MTKDYDVVADNESVMTEKEGILTGELEENSEILTALNDLWVIQSGFREVTSLSEFGELASALASLEIAGSKLASFETKYPGTALQAEISQEIEQLTEQVTKRAENGWSKAIVFDTPFNGQDTKLKVHEIIDDLSLESLYEVIQKIDENKRPTRVEQFLLKLEETVFMPIFDLDIISASRTERELSLKKRTAKPQPRAHDETLQHKPTVDTFTDLLETTIQFLNDVFKASELHIPIIKRFSSMLVQELSNRTLPALFPVDVGELEGFRKQLARIERFDQFLQENGWTKGPELVHWVENFPNEWVFYRKSCYLDRIRTELGQNVSQIRRLDTEFAQNAEVNTQSGSNQDEDDWNKEWGDEDEDEEEDWGWGDEGEQKPEKETNNKDIPGLYCTVSTNIDLMKKLVGEFINEVGTSEKELLSRQLKDVFALYRALTPLTYSDKIILYNDLMTLLSCIDSGELPLVSSEDRSLMVQHANRSISELVDQKRAELTSLLAEARGFKECSPQGNLHACKTAINHCCRLIQNTFTQWSKHGSFPLVCRMVGTLLEAMVTSIMSGIEAQEDISEAECNELSNLIEQTSHLENLFKDPRATQDASTATKLAAFYIPSWIKFQYFGEILQSKLVDIMYLFNDNSLMDFSSSELVHLIRALFAESSHRQRAIDTILSK
ncbi:hypothetical protein TRICI_006151 [Trichomonascus ciferrii]|uniref:ZW10 C-terminal helical domain-containing protein n=1 Tax=Trichomonascus ciferrii TaxID=44093 RepID=A0A642UPN0_9ASCO|nr:hypothetical protein TRICI_006151 [Trichomonascus ciferrii]